MRVTGDTSIGDLLGMHPAATAVFEIVGIDTCCGEPRSLRAACRSIALDTEEAVELLEGGAINTSLPPLPQRPDTSLSELTQAIVKHHHRRARKRLVALIQSARTLCGTHASRFPELWRTRDLIEQLARTMIPHMSNEERFLFPYISTFETGTPNREMVVPLFGTVEFPMQALRHDHADDLDTIHLLREATRGFSVPETACPRFRNLYAELSEFAGELQAHLHIENDTLFPRAVEMESGSPDARLHSSRQCRFRSDKQRANILLADVQ